MNSVEANDAAPAEETPELALQQAGTVATVAMATRAEDTSSEESSSGSSSGQAGESEGNEMDCRAQILKPLEDKCEVKLSIVGHGDQSGEDESGVILVKIEENFDGDTNDDGTAPTTENASGKAANEHSPSSLPTSDTPTDSIKKESQEEAGNSESCESSDNSQSSESTANTSFDSTNNSQDSAADTNNDNSDGSQGTESMTNASTESNDNTDTTTNSTEKAATSVSTPSAKSPTGKSKSGDDLPAMHTIRMSANGFRQRWNGQQWRRLCDDPECPREAQRLSRCAKHQPIKEWRPTRRSRATKTKIKTPDGTTTSVLSVGTSIADLQHRRRHHPYECTPQSISASLLSGAAHNLTTPLSDPLLFPTDSASLSMAASGTNGRGSTSTSASSSSGNASSTSSSEQDDGLPSPMHWGWPSGGPVPSPGYPLPFPTSPSAAAAAAAAYAHHHHHQTFPFENLAMMYGLPSSEQLVHAAAAWPLHPANFGHLP